jgi:hypothetical protein
VQRYPVIPGIRRIEKMEHHAPRRILCAFLSLLFLGLVWAGCSTLKERPRESSKPQDAGPGKYYSFDDVLIPKELNYKQDESFIYESAQLKTGSMIFKAWRIDSPSLIVYFQDHMEKDDWKLVNRYLGRETLLNFTKPDKACTIKIVDRWYGTTVVEVRVGPIESNKVSGRLK